MVDFGRGRDGLADALLEVAVGYVGHRKVRLHHDCGGRPFRFGEVMPERGAMPLRLVNACRGDGAMRSYVRPISYAIVLTSLSHVVGSISKAPLPFAIVAARVASVGAHFSRAIARLAKVAARFASVRVRLAAVRAASASVGASCANVGAVCAHVAIDRASVLVDDTSVPVDDPKGALDCANVPVARATAAVNLPKAALDCTHVSIAFLKVGA